MRRVMGRQRCGRSGRCKGTGGVPFTCPNRQLQRHDANLRRGCRELPQLQHREDHRLRQPRCGDAGSACRATRARRPECASVASRTATARRPRPPSATLSTGTCQACADSSACATKDATKPVCVTTATATLMKGMCVGCLMDTHCTSPQTPICSLDTGTCEGCDAAGTTACMTKDHEQAGLLEGPRPAARPKGRASLRQQQRL